MDREGNIRQGFHIAHDGALDHVDLHKYSGGNSVIVYGQTELTRDLYEARDRLSGKVVHNAEDVALHDLKSDKHYVTYRPGDETLRVDCDYVVGADGFPGSAANRFRKTSCANTRRSIRSAGSACYRHQARVIRTDLCEATARLCAVFAALAGAKPLLLFIRSGAQAAC